MDLNEVPPEHLRRIITDAMGAEWWTRVVFHLEDAGGPASWFAYGGPGRDEVARGVVSWKRAEALDMSPLKVVEEAHHAARAALVHVEGFAVSKPRKVDRGAALEALEESRLEHDDDRGGLRVPAGGVIGSDVEAGVSVLVADDGQGVHVRHESAADAVHVRFDGSFWLVQLFDGATGQPAGRLIGLKRGGA